MRDARGSAVAALTWILWKGRNRLQNLEATSRNFSGPTSFQNVRKTFGGTPAYRFQVFGTLEFFWKKLARLKWPKLCTSAVPTAATAKNVNMSVLRARLPISRGERRVAVQASPNRTELNGRQNHAENSKAEIDVAPLTQS